MDWTQERALQKLTTYTFQAIKTQIYFFTLLFYEFWYFPFLECIATISKRTTTHFILSHHVRLKVANSHTMSYFCGSWWRGTFTAQYTMVREIFQMRRYGIVKLSKLNITQQTALKIFITIIFVHVPNHFE